MTPGSLSATALTVLQAAIVLSVVFRYLRLRKCRAYSSGRVLTHVNRRFAVTGDLSFLVGNTLVIASFWSMHPAFLRWHDAEALRWIGVGIGIAGTLAHGAALRTLGRNYSPCFDAHAPHELVAHGLYRWVRQPVYASSLLIAFGACLASGSLWNVLIGAYGLWEILRIVRNEENSLAATLPGYAAYQKKTARLLPFLY